MSHNVQALSIAPSREARPATELPPPARDEDDKELDTAGSVDEKASPDAPLSHVAQIPRKYRLGALAFIIFITSGIEFAESTLGPLKHTLITELDVNSGWNSDTGHTGAK